MNRSIYYACTALSLVLLAGCKGAPPTAAVVNGQAIPLEDFQHYLMVKPQVQVVVDPQRLQTSGGGQIPQQPYSGQVVGSLGLQALTDLIQQVVVKQLAVDEGVLPNEQQINSDLDERTKANPAFVSSLTNAGFTLPMIRNEVAVELANYNLVTKGITVSDAEVDNYIKEHPTEFTIPESADMEWMLVTDEKSKAAADADLSKGKDFTEVAKKYSAVAATRGTAFPEHYMTRLQSLNPTLPAAVKKAGPHRATDWIKFSEGSAKFYVKSITPERRVAIDDAMKKKVRKALMTRKGAQGKDVAARIREKLKAANIVISIESLRDQWKRAMESINPTPAAATGTGAPTTGTTK